MSFENIIGNQQIKQLLLHSVHTSSLLHSYSFVGIDGIGKSLFALEFSKLILHTSQNLSNHPDFMFIDSEDGKSIKIDQIRHLQSKIAEKPVVSDKKIYIIDHADYMTTEAQNCLLKTLEEPPEYAIIILVLSNESKLLTTVKSRCTKISFKPLSLEDIKQYFTLNQIDLPNDMFLKACNGSIGKALQMQGEISYYEKIDNIFQHLEQEDIINLWNHSDILYTSKDATPHLLEYINLLLIEKLKQTKDIRYARMH